MVEKVAVTGGCGFIGSHLVESLCNDGYDVVVIDNLQPQYGHMSNIRSVLDEIDYDLVSITDYPKIKEVVSSCHTVFHLAAMSHLPHCQRNPYDAYDVNLMGTINILRVCQEQNIKMIFAGTDHIYGECSVEPIKETAVFNPKDIYSMTKVGAINACRLFRDQLGCDIKVLVGSNAFGERQDFSKVIPKFVKQAIEGSPITVHGGNQTRDFIYVKNFVKAYRILEDTESDEFLFNIGGENEMKLIEVANLIHRLLESKSEVVVGSYRYDDTNNSRLALNIDKIKGIGYKPDFTFEKGLANTINWYIEALEK